jgi:hypothetical protein
MVTNQAQPTRFATRFNWIAAFFESVLLNLFGFLLFMMALSAIAISIRNIAEWLIAHDSPWLALAFVVLAGTIWGTLLSFVRPEHLRNPEGRIVPGAALGFVCAVAAVWIYVFASLSFILMKLGLVTYTFSGSPDNALPDLCDAYLWYLLDLIPSLKVNAALGWPPDVDLNGGWGGFVLLLFRIAIVFQLFAIWRALFKERSPQPVAAAAPASGTA